MIASATAVRLGYTLTVALSTLSALHLYWALGGNWGLAAALGRQEVAATPTLRVEAAAVALALIGAATCVLGRVGVWGHPLPSVLFSWGTWGLVAALALAGLVNHTGRTWLERLAFAPLALALAALALTVARSAPP